LKAYGTIAVKINCEKVSYYRRIGKCLLVFGIGKQIIRAELLE